MKRLHVAGMLAFLLVLDAGAADQGVAFYGELYGGSVDSDTALSGYGGLTLPIRQRFSAYIEVLVDKVGDDDSQNIGGHLYWRDPEKGLIGLIASHTEFEVLGTEGDFSGYGLEGELYLSPISLGAQYARIDSNDITLDKKDYFALEAHWDSQSSWYSFVGLRSLDDYNIGYGEVDFTPDSGRSPLTVYGGATWNDFKSQYLGLNYVVKSTAKSDLSLFAQIDNGEDDYDGIFIGIAYGVGPVDNAPLISLFEQVKGGY